MMQYQNSRQIRSPSSMLFRIAINVANDLGRSEQVRRVSDQCSLEAVELVSETPSPEREISAQAGARAAASRHRRSAPQVPAGLSAQSRAAHDIP